MELSIEPPTSHTRGVGFAASTAARDRLGDMGAEALEIENVDQILGKCSRGGHDRILQGQPADVDSQIRHAITS